jgi:anti-sigma-K factor RskA
MSLGEQHSGGSEDDRVLVAEYALGLLEGGERAALSRRLADDPALQRDLRLWRERLATLDREFVETPAPGGVLAQVERRLFGEASAPEKPSGWFGWWSSLSVLRGLVVAGHVLAFAAIGYILVQPPRVDPRALATQLVAALQAQEGSGVEFVAFYDQVSGAVRITSLGGTTLANQDYELWYIKGDAPAVSMGVLPVNERREIPLDAAAKAGIAAGTTLAVTLEQKGGSPTGVAQGPIVAVGTVTPI